MFTLYIVVRIKCPWPYFTIFSVQYNTIQSPFEWVTESEYTLITVIYHITVQVKDILEQEYIHILLVWWQRWRRHTLYHVKMFERECEQLRRPVTASRSLRVVRSDKREPSCSISHFVLVISRARWSCATDPRRAGRRILIKQLSDHRSFDFLFQLPPARTGTGRIALLIFFPLPWQESARLLHRLWWHRRRVITCCF